MVTFKDALVEIEAIAELDAPTCISGHSNFMTSY